MKKRQSNRRQFLTGRSARDAIEDIADRAGNEESASAAKAARPPLLQLTRRAMACQFEILLNRGEASGLIHDAPDYALQALDMVEELEDQLSVYRDHSEVSRINRLAHQAALEIEEGLFQLLRKSIQIYEQTGGAFDITAGPLVKVWGFYRRQGAIPEETPLRDAQQKVGSDAIELNEMQRTVRFGKPGVEINLGAIGKGFALDRCAEFLAFNDVDSFLLHGGLSSVLARGNRQGSDAGWTVGLRHPQRPTARIAEIDLVDQALGTSGAAMQYFHYQGTRYGHVLDPRTGWPVDGVLSATAIAPSAASADALATAFFVMGVESTAEFCKQNPDTAALVITGDQRSGDIQFHAFNLPETAWRPLHQTT